MKHRFLSLLLSVLLITGAVVATSGCEEDVVAVIGLDMPYSFYGLFTPDIDTQWVRVFPIEGSLAVRENKPLDATVTATDLGSGKVEVFRDSVVQTSEGLYEHAFWSPFIALYGHQYRIDVKRSDGQTATSTITVPVRTELEIRAPRLGYPVVLPILVRGVVPNLVSVELDYLVKFSDMPGAERHFKISYSGKPTRVAEGWELLISLTNDYNTLKTGLQASRQLSEWGIRVIDMNLHFMVTSAEWVPPGGVFDRDVLSMPGLMDNVDNGFGFVGAGYRTKLGLMPPNEAAIAAGFRVN